MPEEKKATRLGFLYLNVARAAMLAIDELLESEFHVASHIAKGFICGQRRENV